MFWCVKLISASPTANSVSTNHLPTNLVLPFCPPEQGWWMWGPCLPQQWATVPKAQGGSLSDPLEKEFASKVCNLTFWCYILISVPGYKGDGPDILIGRKAWATKGHPLHNCPSKKGIDWDTERSKFEPVKHIWAVTCSEHGALERKSEHSEQDRLGQDNAQESLVLQQENL